MNLASLLSPKGWQAPQLFRSTTSAELVEGTLVDVLLPTRRGVTIRKRCISRPTEHRAILLEHLGQELPSALEMAVVKTEARPYWKYTTYSHNCGKMG